MGLISSFVSPLFTDRYTPKQMKSIKRGAGIAGGLLGGGLGFGASQLATELIGRHGGIAKKRKQLADLEARGD
jgi:hypothetical protein